jgi:glucose-1-phosphatase
MVKAVFDIGNVLVRASMLWLDALNSSGVKFEKAPSPGLLLYELDEYLPYEAGRVSEADYLEAVRNQFGLASCIDALAVHRSVIGDEVEGVLDFILELHDLGIQTAALSNNNPIHWEWLTEVGPFPAVRALQQRHSSHLLRHHKPELEIYQTFERVTGWKSGEIIFVDDNLANVKAAQARGWRAHHIDPLADIVDQLRAVYFDA